MTPSRNRERAVERKRRIGRSLAYERLARELEKTRKLNRRLERAHIVKTGHLADADAHIKDLVEEYDKVVKERDDLNSAGTKQGVDLLRALAARDAAETALRVRNLDLKDTKGEVERLKHRLELGRKAVLALRDELDFYRGIYKGAEANFMGEEAPVTFERDEAVAEASRPAGGVSCESPGLLYGIYLHYGSDPKPRRLLCSHGVYSWGYEDAYSRSDDFLFGSPEAAQAELDKIRAMRPYPPNVGSTIMNARVERVPS